MTTEEYPNTSHSIDHNSEAREVSAASRRQKGRNIFRPPLGMRFDSLVGEDEALRLGQIILNKDPYEDHLDLVDRLEDLS